jgi:hypothetical protein
MITRDKASCYWFDYAQQASIELARHRSAALPRRCRHSRGHENDIANKFKYDIYFIIFSIMERSQ